MAEAKYCVSTSGSSVMLQVCDVTTLKLLSLSTDAGAWGGDHTRRRSVDLQVSYPSVCKCR